MSIFPKTAGMVFPSTLPQLPEPAAPKVEGGEPRDRAGRNCTGICLICRGVSFLKEPKMAQIKTKQNPQQNQKLGFPAGSVMHFSTASLCKYEHAVRWFWSCVQLSVGFTSFISCSSAFSASWAGNYGFPSNLAGSTAGSHFKLISSGCFSTFLGKNPFSGGFPEIQDMNWALGSSKGTQ